MKVVVVGNCTLDLVFRVPRFPPVDPGGRPHEGHADRDDQDRRRLAGDVEEIEGGQEVLVDDRQHHQPQQQHQKHAVADREDGAWTIEIDGGSMTTVNDPYGTLVVAADSSGTITLADGGELIFDGVERIVW